MSDNELYASAGDPDEYSEWSGNPDEDWDGVDAVDGDDSNVVLPMNDSIEPGSACKVLWTSQGVHAVSYKDYWLDNCSGC